MTTDERNARFLELLAGGLTVKEAGATLGLKRTAAYDLARRLKPEAAARDTVPPAVEDEPAEDGEGEPDDAAIGRALARALVRAQKSGDPKTIAAVASAWSQHTARHDAAADQLHLDKLIDQLDDDALRQEVARIDGRQHARLADACYARDVVIQQPIGDLTDQAVLAVSLATGELVTPEVACEWLTTWAATLEQMLADVLAIESRHRAEHAARALDDEPDHPTQETTTP